MYIHGIKPRFKKIRIIYIPLSRVICGWLENQPSIDGFPSYKLPFSSAVFSWSQNKALLHPLVNHHFPLKMAIWGLSHFQTFYLYIMTYIYIYLYIDSWLYIQLSHEISHYIPNSHVDKTSMARFYKYDADKDGFWSKAEFCVWLPGDEPGGRRHKIIIKNEGVPSGYWTWLWKISYL